MKKFTGLLPALLLLMIAGCPKKPVELSPEELMMKGPEAARKVIAEEYRLKPEDLVETEPVLIQAPLSNDYFFREKFVEPKSGQVYSIALGKSLEKLDVLKFVERERGLFKDRYGKLEPSLKDTLALLKPADRIRVAIWLAFDDSLESDRVDLRGAGKLSDFESIYRRRIKKFEQSISGTQEGLIKDLGQRDIKILRKSKYAPVVFYELTAEQIESAARHPDVVQINLGHTYEDEHDSSIPTLRADVVHAQGIDGNGVDIAICEDGRVSAANPNLNLVSTMDNSITVTAHATHVAGDAASSHSSLPGVAPGADIYSACADSYDDDDLIEAIDWAIDQNVRIINCSFGFDTGREMDALDRYFDYVIRKYWVTITKSAGNRGNDDGDVTSPGLAWNVITCGGINDGGNSNWSDDVMYSKSSYGDPKSTHGDREKPEVCAVAQNVKSTTTASPWVQSGLGGSGTSFAAPMIAGTAALAIQRNGNLAYWPEVIKALIMAGASHNIEGSQRLSEYDGAGVVVVSTVDSMVTSGWYNGYKLWKSDFNSSGDFNVSIPNVNKGQRIKAVICWDSTPIKVSIFWFTYYFDILAADFDLRLYAPDGSYAGGSYSWDNSYEVVDVTAAQSGTYTLKIHKYRMDSDWEWLGIAWQR